jgi:uncharacterized membrane protein YedE/YeeE
MEQMTPIPSLIGGVLIGLSGALLLISGGRIAGISGIVGGLLAPFESESPWRLAFVIGLIGASIALFAGHPAAFAQGAPASPWVLAVAGLLVGVGTRVGSGCTSGHGVCGIGRFSLRSLIATAVFIIAGILAVALARQLTGGGSP